MTPFRLSLFRYVITRFGRLRNQWLLTQLFDAFLALLTVLTAPRVTVGIAKISNRMLRWPDVSRSRHQLGGRQFNYRGVELGHIHSNGVADIRLSRREHDDVVNRRLALPHHVAPHTSWVTWYIDGPNDTERVLGLFDIALQRLIDGNQTQTDQPTEEG